MQVQKQLKFYNGTNGDLALTERERERPNLLMFTSAAVRCVVLPCGAAPCGATPHSTATQRVVSGRVFRLQYAITSYVDANDVKFHLLMLP